MRKRRIERNLDHNEINKNDGKEIDKMLKLNKVDKGKLNHETILKHKDNLEINKDDYTRPSHWRVGMRDEVWDSAKDEYGRVRDPVTGRYMSKNQAWDMGHKPGYEFYKHQKSAENRGITRQQFLNEYYNPEHYRPELPSSNRNHKGEDVTDNYFGD